MQTAKLSLVLFLASATILGVSAQPASPEAQEKAIQLLRQTLSQGGATSSAPEQAPANAAPMAPATSSSMTGHEHAMPAAPSGPITPASAEQQQQAIELLRQKMSEPAPAGSATSSSKKSTAKAAKKGSKPAATGSQAPGMTQSSSNVTVTPSAATEPSGPQTKQQKLRDLLELYKADKISPAEYQARRAKILAEP